MVFPAGGVRFWYTLVEEVYRVVSVRSGTVVPHLRRGIAASRRVARRSRWLAGTHHPKWGTPGVGQANRSHISSSLPFWRLFLGERLYHQTQAIRQPAGTAHLIRHGVPG